MSCVPFLCADSCYGYALFRVTYESWRREKHGEKHRETSALDCPFLGRPASSSAAEALSLAARSSRQSRSLDARRKEGAPLLIYRPGGGETRGNER